MKTRVILVIIFIAGIIISFFISTSAVYACEKTLPLGIEKTIERTDLIIIGQKVGEGPKGETEYPFPGEPAWVDIKITETLKGTSNKNPIRIKTNSACGYGFPAPENKEKYVMFFKWDGGAESFKEVDAGAEKLLKLINGAIYYTERDSEGVYREKSESIDNFIQKFNLSRKNIENSYDNNKLLRRTDIYYAISIVIILSTVIFLILRVNKSSNYHN